MTSFSIMLLSSYSTNEKPPSPDVRRRFFMRSVRVSSFSKNRPTVMSDEAAFSGSSLTVIVRMGMKMRSTAIIGIFKIRLLRMALHVSSILGFMAIPFSYKSRY